MLELRQAFRSLVKNPAFTLVAVATLALGIGATTAIWSLVHAVLLRPLPYPDPERLVIVWENDRVRGTERETASYPDYLDLVAQSRSFEALAAIQELNRTLTGIGDEALRTGVAAITPSWLDALGTQPLVGRRFDGDDARPEAPRVALLGETLWRERFGGDRGVIGQTLRIDGAPLEVVGVVPDETSLSGAQVWMTLTGAERTATERGVHSLLLVGRLRDGVTHEQAQAELDAIMARLETAYPDHNHGRGARIVGLHEEAVGQARTPLLTLLGAVAGVLLIACANVANLMLARGSVREREMAVRAALGGGRARLVRLLLTESAVLAALGGALGLAVATAGLKALRALAPAGMPGIAQASLDGAAMLASAVVVLGSIVLFGLVPAWRGGSVDPGRALARGTRGGSSRGWTMGVRGGVGGERSRHLLVAIEAALAVLLVAGAALLLRSFLEMRRVEPGYEADGLITLRLELPEATYPPPPSWPWLEWPRATQFHDALLERVRALPGVRSAGLALNGPAMSGWTTRVEIVGRPPMPPGEQDEATYSPVSADYLKTLGVPLARGRWLDATERPGAPLAVVVNESFARRHFPDRDPVGERITFFDVTTEVVGVIGDMRSGGLLSEPRPTFYPALSQFPWGQLSLVARIDGDPARLERELRAVVQAINPDVAAFDVATVSEQMAGSIARQRFTALLLGVFAGLALSLAAVGIYGLVALSIAQRTREIGLRIALGASRGRVLGDTMRRGLLSTAAGIAVGLAASLALARLLRGQLYGIGPDDAATYVVVVAALFVTSLVAAWLPARRATRIAPAEALRQD